MCNIIERHEVSFDANTQHCATRTTSDGSELTVSRSSTNLMNMYHQVASATCKENEEPSYIRYIAKGSKRTALFNDSLRFYFWSSFGEGSVPCGALFLKQGFSLLF